MALKDFVGRWRIYKMEDFEQDYVDENVKAYIEIQKSGTGRFQFGYVHGEIDGRVAKFPGFERLEFTWDGNDECDHAFGSGWLKADGNTAEGEIRIHGGDSYKFLANKTEGKK